ncbi:MAG: 4Fe-4S binding protein [bacterium]|nr:4Fe-4S binding protein [bacterium]
MSKRRIIQILGAVIPNTYVQAFTGKLLYQGVLKGFCVPSLNCYSCPLAVFACPIGTLQHFVVIRQFPFYLIGWLGLLGTLVGRMACGFICPFGLVQDLMYKIRSFKIRLPNWSRYLKYIWLVSVAILIPYFTGEYWFSKLCPQGTLQASVPLVLASQKIRSLVGGATSGSLFVIKVAILCIFLFLFVISKRPFCITTCPLGAIYSIFNKISLIGLRIDKKLCDDCGLCVNVCPTGIKPYDELNHIDCIRCAECKRVCPRNAIRWRY